MLEEISKYSLIWSCYGHTDNMVAVMIGSSCFVSMLILEIHEQLKIIVLFLILFSSELED